MKQVLLLLLVAGLVGGCSYLSPKKDAPTMSDMWRATGQKVALDDLVASGKIQAVIPMHSAMRFCTSNSDCIIVQRDCGGCSCGRVIHKVHLMDYMEQAIRFCREQSYRNCNVSCPDFFPQCQGGTCGKGYVEGDLR